MTDTLFAEPEKDGFKHESPIRAFTDYTMDGSYFIGKGFRPSVAHLAAYLAAMESKEGYRLVQILEAAGKSPTMIFHKAEKPVIAYRYLTPPLMGGEEITPMARMARSFVTKTEELGEASDPKAALNRAKLDVALDQLRKESGADLETVHWNTKIKDGTWSLASIDALIHAFQRKAAEDKAACKKFLEAEEVHDLYQFKTTASVASMQRLANFMHFIIADGAEEELDKIRETLPVITLDDVDRFMKEQGFAMVAEPDGALRVYKVCDDPNCHVADVPDHRHDDVDGSDTPPAMRHVVDIIQAHKGEIKAALADDEPVKRNVKREWETMGFNDDPINPKHYAGRECADIGERLSANGYQILKYCWRLGKKDDPCQELGKALWYADSETKLIRTMGGPAQSVHPNVWGIKHVDAWFEDRIQDQPTFTQSIARMLWEGYNARRLRAIIEAIEEHKFHLDCGRGLAV
jgi:hypothetical protein